MRDLIREYFTFTRQNKRALLLLAGILVTGIAALPLVGRWVRAESAEAVELGGLSDSLDALWADDDSLAVPATLAYFDPNKLTADEWRSMGLDDRVITNILNYRKAGGKFYRKEDLLRIYSFTKDDYLRLLPYIRIEGDRSRWTGTRHGNSRWDERGNSASRRDVRIGINSADSTEWTTLNGIGPVLASRIVKYRRRIGGFTEIDQLKQVYGLPPETFDAIKPQLLLDSIPEALPSGTAAISQHAQSHHVELNTADSALLDALPGVGRYTAAEIAEYRVQLGGFYSKDQLLEVRGLKPEFLAMFIDKVTVDTISILKLNLNEATHTELEAHPYISKSLADYIVTYRSRTPFQTITELRKSFLVDEELYKKLRPYLAP